MDKATKILTDSLHRAEQHLAFAPMDSDMLRGWAEIIKEHSEALAELQAYKAKFEELEAELKAKDEQIEELEKSRLRWLKLSDEFNDELKAKDEQLAQAEAGYKEAVKEVEALDLAHKAKDECIANLSAERDKYNTVAANLQISRQKAYDNIAKLETIIEKMKCCENCESHTNVGSNCLLDMEDSLDCRANNYLNWKLKDNG